MGKHEKAQCRDQQLRRVIALFRRRVPFGYPGIYIVQVMKPALRAREAAVRSGNSLPPSVWMLD
jgi:hypothetical protein